MSTSWSSQILTDDHAAAASANQAEVASFRADLGNATNGLRDTAKWISGGAAVAAGGVLAGSALTGLGSVEPLWRLLLAIAGALAGLGALGLILWRAVDVLAPRRLPLSAFLDPRIVPLKVRQVIETDLARMFPRGVGKYTGSVPSFAALQEVMNTLTERLHSTDKSQKAAAQKAAAQVEVDKILKALDFLLPAATFEELRLRFLKVKDAVFIGGAAAVIGFGVYAWAASPPKEPTLLKSPVFRTIKVDPLDLQILKTKWTDAKCVNVDLPIIELRIWLSGISDVVTVPSSSSCPPLLLQLRVGRLSAPQS
jgi:hypothetical protein